MRPLLLAASPLLLVAPLRAQNCSATSVGFTPLNDLAGGAYQGAEGGLYPGDGNAIPAGHLSAGLAEAAQVVPRDAAGAPDPNGKIGFLSIGMSNTRLHFADFAGKAGADPERDAHVVVLNTAQGGVPAEDMDDPNDPYWDFVAQTVAGAGLAPAQVQVVWMLQANRQPTDPFPDHALGLRDQMASILAIVRDEYPNARLAFLGARIYAGYAVSTLNPEPWAYEQSFANKWLIEAQMAGSPDLNFDPDAGPVEAPWIA